MAGAPGAPRSHGFFQRFQKRHFWRAMPGGIHRGVPTALGPLKKKEKSMTVVAIHRTSFLYPFLFLLHTLLLIVHH